MSSKKVQAKVPPALHRSQSSASIKVAKTKDKARAMLSSRTASSHALLPVDTRGEWERALEPAPSRSQFEQLCAGVQAMAVELFSSSSPSTSSQHQSSSDHHSHAASAKEKHHRPLSRAQTPLTGLDRAAIAAAAAGAVAVCDMKCITFSAHCRLTSQCC